MSLTQKHRRLDLINPDVEEIKRESQPVHSFIRLVEFEYKFLDRRLWYTSSYFNPDWRLGHSYRRYIAGKHSHSVYELKGLDCSGDDIENAEIAPTTITGDEARVISDSWIDYRWITNPETGNKYQLEDKPRFLSERQNFKLYSLPVEKELITKDNQLVWLREHPSRLFQLVDENQQNESKAVASIRSNTL